MWAYILLLTLSCVQALEPSHLRPGALVAHLGQVSLVEDVLWVRYPYTALVKIPVKLRETSERLQAVLGRLKEVDPEGRAEWMEWKNLMNVRLVYLADTVNLALENYSDLNGSTRTKRGLVDGIGKLSRMLFGTAMNEDVEDLRNRYNRLASIATANNRTLHFNCFRISKLEQHVNDLAQYSTKLQSALNTALNSLKDIYNFMTISQVLPVLENVVNSMLHTNQLILQNVVDASRGRVTNSLFPVKDLLRTLDIGRRQYGLKPLFDSRGIQHYYPLLESVLTSDAVVIHVPFESQDTFEVYQIEPFPFAVNGTIMTIDLAPSIVLISKDFSLYAVGHLSDLQHCKTQYLHLYHCEASSFAFLSLQGGVCEAVLTQGDASRALSLCPYRRLTPSPFFHESFFGYHYFFFTQQYFVSVVCPDGTEYKELSGHFAVPNACYVRSANLTTFPSKLYKGFIANLTVRIFPLDSLTNVTFSHIKYVTNSLSEFTFSNTSELESVIQDSLPVYLSPSVHVPSIIAPVVIILIVVIPLCLLVRKALTLYSHLKQRLADNTDTSSPV